MFSFLDNDPNKKHLLTKITITTPKFQRVEVNAETAKINDNKVSVKLTPHFSSTIDKENIAIQRLANLGEMTLTLCPATGKEPAQVLIQNLKTPININYASDALEEFAFH